MNSGDVGVFASDTLPHCVNLPSYIVVNTDPHTEEGSHWYGIYIDVNKNAIFFDSYGRRAPNEVLIFLRRCANRWHQNDLLMQNFSSNVCGQYCLLFLLFMYNNYNLREFQSLFSKNLFQNDNIVKKMFSIHFKKLELHELVTSTKFIIQHCKNIL